MYVHLVSTGSHTLDSTWYSTARFTLVCLDLLLSQLDVQCICCEAPLVYPGAEYTGVSLVCTEKPGTSLVRGCAPHGLHHSPPCSDHMGTAVALDKAGAGGALTPPTRTGGTHTPQTRPPQAAPQCSDYRQVAPRSKRSSDLFERSNKSRVAGLVGLKMLDLAVHLYTVAVSSFSLHLAVANLHQVKL